MRVVRARTEEDAYFIFAGEPTALQRRVVQTVIAIERKKVTFGDVTSRIHAMMPRRGKTAHVDARAFFHDLFHGRLVAGDDDRLGALLHSLITEICSATWCVRV